MPHGLYMYLINPRRMRSRVTVVILCVCLSVGLLPQNQLPTSFLRSKQSFIGFFIVFSTFYRLAFPENASFKRYGAICRSPLPSSLPGELSTAKRGSDGFFSTRKVYMVGYRSNNTTGSSLIVVQCTLSEKLLGYLCIL